MDQATNENKSMGTMMFLIRPVSPSYQLMIYQNQASPLVSLTIAQSINFSLRGQVYGYLTDPQGTQWTVQFADASTAARCAISIGAIVTQADGKKLAVYDVGVGTGPTVSVNDQVVVSYIGFLATQLPHLQAQFDANENFSFAIGSDRIIKGYSAGVDGMRVEGTRAIVVPPDLGYGAAGARGVIPPNATLTFLITLKSATVKAKPQENRPPQTVSQPAQPPPVAPNPEPRPQTTVERLQRSGAVPVPTATAPEAPRAPDAPARAKRSLWGDDDGDSDRRLSRDGPAMPTVDEPEVLQRMDQLTELIRTRFDALAVSMPVTMKPGDVVYEVQALAAEIEDKERQLREQQQLIDDLKRSKQNSRLRAELDVAQTELQSLRSLLKGGRDFRRENDELRAELRQLREGKLVEMERNLSDLRIQLARQHQIARETAARNTKELIYAFMGAAIEKLNARFARQTQIATRDLSGAVYDVFHQCSEEIVKQIDERGLV
jgi:hypothetical protein